jgi:hypothetical protein
MFLQSQRSEHEEHFYNELAVEVALDDIREKTKKVYGTPEKPLYVVD